MRRRCTTLVLTVSAALALTGCSGSAAPVRPVAAVVSAPTTAVETGPAPRPGTVVQGVGPFDDRFTLSGLTLAQGAVTGQLLITSDVSEIIVLEVHAAFYDTAGTLLGRVVQVHQDDHGGNGSGVAGLPDESVAVAVTAPAAYRDRVSAARVTVPVLVNE